MPSTRVTRSPSSRWSERALKMAQFGTVFSDHILVANYENGQWGEPEIVPYGPLPLPPAPSALHYGQAVFAGFRAHRTLGRVRWRPTSLGQSAWWLRNDMCEPFPAALETSNRPEITLAACSRLVTRRNAAIRASSGSTGWSAVSLRSAG
jgi:hypothetical protein